MQKLLIAVCQIYHSLLEVFVFIGDAGKLCYVEELLNLLMLTLRVGKAYKTLLEEMIKTVVQGALFKASDNNSLPMMIQSSQYVASQDRFHFQDTQAFISAKLIRDFCRDIISQVPSVSRCLLPVVGAINEKISNPSTQDFLFKFMSLALSGESMMISDEGAYLIVYRFS